jgi:hypothetical protein
MDNGTTTQPVVDEAMFAALVEAKVAERFAELEAKLLEAVENAAPEEAPASVKPDASMKAMIENLSMAFADISAQGIGVQKPVAPDVLRARDEAHERMIGLIRKASEEGRIPTYRIIKPVYLDEAYVVETWDDSDHVRQATEIDWPGVPNHVMIPLNDVAKEIKQAFLDSVGNMGTVSRVEKLAEFQRGLNVRGPKRAERAQPAPSQFDAPYQGLNIRHQNARGRTRLTHVLGTIAPPAEVSGL